MYASAKLKERERKSYNILADSKINETGLGENYSILYKCYIYARQLAETVVVVAARTCSK